MVKSAGPRLQYISEPFQPTGLPFWGLCGFPLFSQSGRYCLQKAIHNNLLTYLRSWHDLGLQPLSGKIKKSQPYIWDLKGFKSPIYPLMHWNMQESLLKASFSPGQHWAASSLKVSLLGFTCYKMCNEPYTLHFLPSSLGSNSWKWERGALGGSTASPAPLTGVTVILTHIHCKMSHFSNSSVPAAPTLCKSLHLLPSLIFVT